jgi:hypothetical protein
MGITEVPVGGRAYPAMWGTPIRRIWLRYHFGMTVDSNEASWSSLEPMGPAQKPRLITKADVPRLGDRIKDVLKSDSQHRSGWEITVSVISLVLLMSANSVIWGSPSNVGLKIVESIIALAVMGTAATAVLVKLRFRG